MLLADITMPMFVEGLQLTRTVLIPFGATEEHGPHLPLATDTMQADQVCRRLAALRPLFVAPPVPYGVCRSTGDHPGTIGITTATLRALAIDIVTSLYRQGLRNFVLLTGHAGVTHTSTMVDAGEELLERFADARIAVLTEFMLAATAGRDFIETPDDAHAGEIETSRIMHTHPDLVRGSAPREYPNFPIGILVRDKRRYWPNGVWGDPGKASAEKGEKIEAAVVTALGKLVEALERGEND
jgi:creatinine amidohydrolase